MSGEATGNPSPVTARTQIDSSTSKLLLVEGREEELFFEEMMKSDPILAAVQVMSFCGKNNLRAFLAPLKKDPLFPQVKTIAVIRDADYHQSQSQPRNQATAHRARETGAAQLALQSVRDSLQYHNLPRPAKHGCFVTGPPRVGVFIMPDGENDGMLETLCMRSVDDKPEAECVKLYFQCLNKKSLFPRPLDKARAHVWLASRREPDKRVGEAAQAGYWPFDHAAFGDLWKFIRAM